MKRSCRELLLRELRGPRISGDLVEGPFIYKSCQVEMDFLPGGPEISGDLV